MSIRQACLNNNLNQVKILLEENNTLKNQRNKKTGETPLHFAVKIGSNRIVKLLLDYGADTTVQNNDGITPLQSAREFNKTNIVKLFNKYEDHKKYINNTTPGNNLSIVSQYSSNLSNIDMALLDACKNNNLNSVNIAINAGASINLNYEHGWTPLHFASNHNNVRLANLLLDKGASINIQNNTGFTPLHYACMQGHINIIKLLVGRGANVNIENIYGETPFYYAALKGCLECMIFLYDNGADKTNINAILENKIIKTNIKYDFEKYMLLKKNDFSGGSNKYYKKYMKYKLKYHFAKIEKNGLS